MPTRRDFFKQAGLLSGLLASIQKASAIDPEEGSTFLDAEHVVILMQENRSFDHAFGTLRGVRGFNDPRAVTLPDQNPVWMQTNAAGETYAPFRLNIKESNATWLGSLPHSWRDQTDARNQGNHDKWLDAKPSGHKGCEGKPLTLGFYNREDLPFYYALADAFTICDQNFCSSLTGTTPNRLYLWTGTIREKQDAASFANVRNSDVDYGKNVKWTTFPERLEDAGVSWKIYQNEVSLPSGFSDEEDSWLANFTDNPIEWFEQHRVEFSTTFRSHLEKLAVSLPKEIEELRKAGKTKELQKKEAELQQVTEARKKWTADAYAKLSEREKNLFTKAFTTNVGDPNYRKLAKIRYQDGGQTREMSAPAGDVLYQFRKDVTDGTLPTVSWLVPPEKFSDHPGAPWYGAWYLSEVLNILTHKPEVWKKTIFILTYDENDGYFDHVPPFVAPDPSRPETGKTSPGIDAGVEYWPLKRDLEAKPAKEARGSSIGLGFRVPLVVASPWSRGGFVCSQVFDHTSVLQLLEKVASKRTKREIKETNISTWRRTVCGDLTAAFNSGKKKDTELTFPTRDAVLESIHKAQFKQLPSGYRQLSVADREQFQRDRFAVPWMPHQEQGVRPSLALPYELSAEGKMSADGRAFEIVLEAKKEIFGKTAVGSPFHVYTPGKFQQQVNLRARAYAVAAGDRLTDSWTMDGFENGLYHLRICGPNGFFRELVGSAADPQIEVRCDHLRNGGVEISVSNGDREREWTIEIADRAYGNGSRSATVSPGGKKSIALRLDRNFHWYDFSVRIAGVEKFERRYAGRVETGKAGFSDPAMGRMPINRLASR